jgi:hypothetical protein
MNLLVATGQNFILNCTCLSHKKEKLEKRVMKRPSLKRLG